MELAVRKGPDRFVPPGTYRSLEARLKRHSAELAEIPAVVLSTFDRRTRMLPFVLYDSRIFPLGARSIAGTLYQAGFYRTRAVFQLWNPRFRPSRAQIDGRPAQMLLISSMQIHTESAYEAIRDAWTLGADRPLIVVGGSKAMYEPYHFWSIPCRDRVAPDVVVTGESFVFLELLNAIVEYRRHGETMRVAFERARLQRALQNIPGLVYLAPEATLAEPTVEDTGMQRLVQDLDEMPHEVTGLSLMEPPHREVGLSANPIPDAEVRRHAMIASLQVTQGCKFTCAYCPIPAQNQKSWRYRSPEGLAHEIRSVNERFGIKYFFGADDNFFNHRQTAEELLSAMARAKTRGRSFGERIRFATEATQADTYKNRDLLPLARAGGMYSIWFGIEDLTATLVNKGQKPAVTIELFRLMHQHQISPMAMIMFHEGQPYHSRGSLYGLYNQAEFLRSAGAISFQCTAHTPSAGTSEYEKTYETGRVIARIGRYTIPEAMVDGNHVVVMGADAPWKRQFQLLGGYAAFYNPRNLIRAFKRDGSRLRNRRIGWQAAGFIAMVWTAFKILPYTIRLMTGRLTCHSAPPVLKTVPVREVESGFSRSPATPRIRTRQGNLSPAGVPPADFQSETLATAQPTKSV